MFKITFILIMFIVFSLDFSESIKCDVTPLNSENRLRHNLFCNSDLNTMPKGKNGNKNITISVKLTIKQYSYNNKGIFTIHDWMMCLWSDDRLKWDSRDYDGIDSIGVPYGIIWQPELTVQNDEKSKLSSSCSKQNCYLQNNGKITCVLKCSHKSYCQPKYDNWPFDSQNCTMTIGAWKHKTSDIHPKSTLTNFVGNSIGSLEWRLIEMNINEAVQNYTCCPDDTYRTIQYSFLIQRHSASIKAFVIAPAIVFSIINLMTLLLEPNRTERILLSILAILAHWNIINHLSWLVPKNGDTVPNMILYVRNSLIISAVLLLNTVIMRGIWLYKSTTPEWIKNITLSLKFSKVGEYIFAKDYLLGRTPLNDEIVAKEENATEAQEEAGHTNNKERNVWQTTVRLFDRIMLLVFIIIYVIMIISLATPSYSFQEGPVRVKQNSI